MGYHGRCPVVSGVNIVIEIADNGRPLLLGLLVKIGNGDTGGEDGIIGVGNGHVRSCLSSLEQRLVCYFREVTKSSYKIVKLNSGHTTIDTRYDLHGDGNGVNMLRVEAVTQPGDTGCDLVELNALLASI